MLDTVEECGTRPKATAAFAAQGGRSKPSVGTVATPRRHEGKKKKEAYCLCVRVRCFPIDLWRKCRSLHDGLAHFVAHARLVRRGFRAGRDRKNRNISNASGQKDIPQVKVSYDLIKVCCDGPCPVRDCGRSALDASHERLRILACCANQLSGRVGRRSDSFSTARGKNMLEAFLRTSCRMGWTVVRSKLRAASFDGALQVRGKAATSVDIAHTTFSCLCGRLDDDEIGDKVLHLRVRRAVPALMEKWRWREPRGH